MTDKVLWEIIYKKYEGRYDDLVSAYVEIYEYVLDFKRQLKELKKEINGGKNEKK